jgi:hypothetical protein
MATQDLDKNRIDAGMKLLQELDKNPSLDIVAALWYFDTDLERWEFLIYPPEFYKKITDLKEFYRIVDDCLIKNLDISEYIQLSEVWLLSHSRENIIKVLKKIPKTYDKYSRINLGGIVVDGLYLESVFIYRNSI